MPNLSLIDSARVLVTHLRMRTLQAASRAELRRITRDSQPGSKRLISIRETRFHMDRAALAALAETCAKAVMASGDPEALARMKAYCQQVTAMGEYQPVKRAPSKRRTSAPATREARSIAVPAMAYPRASGPCHRPEADGNDMRETRMLRTESTTPEQPQARSIAVPAMAYPRASGPCHRPEADGNDMRETRMLRTESTTPRSIAVPAMAYPRASGPCHRPEADGNDMPGTGMLRTESTTPRSIAVPAMAYPRASGPCHRPEADGNDMPGTGMLRSILPDACHWRSPEVSARLAA